MADITFEELTGRTVAAPEHDPLATMHDVGRDTEDAAFEEEKRIAEESTVIDMAKAAWDENIADNLYEYLDRKWSYAPEEGFDVQQYVEENKHMIPMQHAESFAGVRSVGEADALREDMIRQDEGSRMLQANGMSGMAAQLVVGLVDVDLPVMLASGGWAALAKGTVRGVLRHQITRRPLSALAYSPATGAVLGGANAAISTAVDPNGDAADIVDGVLFGAALGTIGGAVAARSAHRINKAVNQTRRDYSQAVKDAPSPTEEFAEAPVYGADDGPQLDADGKPQQFQSSLGADSTIPADDFSSLNAEEAKILSESKDNLARKGAAVDMDDPEFADTSIGRTAKAFSNALSKEWTDGGWMPTTLKTDYDRLATDGGSIEQNIAFEFFESAEGRVVNNRSAAMLRENYEQRLASHSMPVMEDSFGKWATHRNLSLLERNSPSQRAKFDREVYAEMEARFWEGKPVSQDPHVRATADGLDNNFFEAIDIGKGRSNERSIFGWDFEKKSGYVPHRWDGNQIRKIMKRGIERVRIEKLIAQEYRKQSPNITAADAKVISKAVVNRAMNKADGVDANMLATLDADGVHILDDILKDAKVSEVKRKEMISRMRGEQNKKGALGQSQSRMQMDMRASDGDLTLMDLVDTNMTRLVSRYNRQVSGAAAMARKGITSRGDRKALISAAIAERNALGKSTDGVQEYLEDVFTHFDAGPIAGGVSPWVARIKRLTNLGLLNQMGMTQTMETGAAMNAAGVELWGKHAKVVMKQLKDGGPDSPLAMELKPHMGELGKEHILQRDDLMMDELGGKAAADASELDAYLDTFDMALGKGQRLQGIVSGFYAVRSMQQKIAVVSMADKVMQRLRDGVDEADLRNIGVPESMKKYIDNGTVEFMPDGTTNKLNLEKWAPEDAEDLALALHRHTNIVVQKAMAGEDSVWMHKSVGSLFLHLKTFPLLAMRKQFIRNASLGNSQFVGQMLMGLGFAAALGTAKQVINGRTEHVSPSSIAKNAFGMSNMTGWFPMLVDPAAEMLGIRSLQMGSFGRHSIDSGIFAAPPALGYMNKVAHMGGVVNPFSEMTPNEKIRTMQALPIVGNIYGMSYMFNAMKETRQESAARRKAEKAGSDPKVRDSKTPMVSADQQAAAEAQAKAAFERTGITHEDDARIQRRHAHDANRGKNDATVDKTFEELFGR